MVYSVLWTTLLSLYCLWFIHSPSTITQDYGEEACVLLFTRSVLIHGMSERSVSFPTQSKFDAFPYVSCLRKETFRTSNTKLNVSVGILWETEKIYTNFL
jgi:hypothetical protein